MVIGEGFVPFLASDRCFSVCTSFALDQIIWPAYAIMQQVVNECIFGSVDYFTPSERIDTLSLLGEGSRMGTFQIKYFLIAMYSF